MVLQGKEEHTCVYCQYGAGKKCDGGSKWSTALLITFYSGLSSKWALPVSLCPCQCLLTTVGGCVRS